MLINGEPYFVGKDVALAIGYTETSICNAIKSHVKDKYKRESQIATPSGIQTMTAATPLILTIVLCLNCNENYQ